jgi:hypothetical protein
MLIQGQVLAPPTTSATDGNQYTLMMGKQFDLMVSELHGKYFTQNQRGNLFTAALTAASALPAPATNATPNFILWNPAGNTKAISLVSFQLGYVAGTPAAGAIGYSYIPLAGSAMATAAPISALTALTVRSSVVGQAYAGAVLAGSAATVTGTGTSIGTVLRWSGISQGVLASASVPPGMLMREDFDGTMIIPPGNAWYPICSAASVATYMVSAVWEEVPYP